MGPPTLDVQIFECEECRSGSDGLGIKRPLSSLEGRITLSSEVKIRITALRAAFQGHQHSRAVAYADDHALNTTGSYGDRITIANSHKFLDVVYHPPLASITDTESPSSSHKYSANFSFLIPETTDRVYAESPDICQLLPPSFIGTELFPSWRNQQPQPRADVVYSLCVTLEYEHLEATEHRSLHPNKLEHEKQINFLPYSEAQPPVDTASFPHEFITSQDIPIWRNFIGGSLGSVKLATREPEPLTYISVSSSAGTHCILTFSIDGPPSIYQYLRKLEIRIKPLIRAKTYYTTEEMPCLPRQTSLSQRGLLRLKDSVMRLPPQSFPAISWQFLPSGLTIDDQLPPRYSESAVPLTLPPFTPASNSVAGTWRASIKLAIQPLETLLPTFCSRFIARSYAVLMHLSIGGLYGKAVDLEVPLQVVYSRSVEEHDHLDSVCNSSRRESQCRGVASLLNQNKVLPLYWETMAINESQAM